MNRKKLLAVVLAVVIIAGIACKDSLIRAYVKANRPRLEACAQSLLTSPDPSDARCGLWDVDVYPQQGLVEFNTGAFGLVPATTYKGFYYSADDTHRVFSAAGGAAVQLQVNGDRAEWTDGTDNHGSSVRICPNWFWYEASF